MYEYSVLTSVCIYANYVAVLWVLLKLEGVEKLHGGDPLDNKCWYFG